MRLMLPDGSRLYWLQAYSNGTMLLTIKTDAAIAAQHKSRAKPTLVIGQPEDEQI